MHKHSSGSWFKSSSCMNIAVRRLFFIITIHQTSFSVQPFSQFIPKMIQTDRRSYRASCRANQLLPKPSWLFVVWKAFDHRVWQRAKENWLQWTQKCSEQNVGQKERRGVKSLHFRLKFCLCFVQQKEWREDRNGVFKKKVARCVRRSQEMAFD